MSLSASVARGIAALLAPLAVALESPDRLSSMLADLGYDVELTAEQLPLLAEVLPVADQLAELLAAAEELAAGTAQAGELVERIVTTAAAVAAAVDDLAGRTASDLAGLAAPLDDPDTWVELAGALPGYLLLQWVRLNHPLPHALLTLGGVIEAVERGAGLPPDQVLSWEALGGLLSDPVEQLRSTYQWGGRFEHERLLAALGATLRAAGVDARSTALPATVVDAHFGGVPPSSVLALTVPVLDEVAAGGGYVLLGLVVAPVPTDGGGGEPTGLLVSNEVVGSTGASIALDGGRTLSLGAAAEESGAMGVVIGPAGTGPAAAAVGAGATIRLAVTPAVPWPLLGDGEGTRVELRDVALELAVHGSATDLELVVVLETADGFAVVIEPGDADSFVAGLLGALPLELTTALSLRWSSRDGLTLGGQLGFALTVPLDLRIGPVSVSALAFAVLGGTDGASVVVTVTGSATLGPFTVVVQGLGIAAALSPAPDGSGAFGSADLALRFQPPSGFGLAIEAGVVSGGGFLWIDPAGTGYAGVLDFGVLGIRICAVGIVDTALPGGGWSLFLALFIDVPSVQLGFGFTLTGVGGLAGINRNLDVDALQAAIRAGSLDDILFPPNPIQDAPFIIEQFDPIFPSAAGRHTFGPVVRIGWGTPTLVEAVLGIVISLPDPVVVAVLGSVTALLPVPELALVALHLDVAGVVDTAAQTLSVDASLHDSQVAGFALSGGMALRADFGHLPSFLMALGGFHPGFDPLQEFPVQRRLSLAISAGSTIDVHFDCYFAITSNTVQFGSRFELSAGIEGFGVEGGTEFDALIQFSPFLVSTRLGFHVAITAAGVDLAGVWLDATVVGPNPWQIVGVARFKLLGLEEELHVDETIGQRRTEPSVEQADLRQLVRDALSVPDAWTVVSTGSTGVTVSAVAMAPDELVADPAAVVAVAQQVAPLGIALDKAGDAPVVDYQLFTVEAGGGGLAASGEVSDWFAPGNFVELSATEGLSAPSFELLTAGIEFGGGETSAGPDRAGSLDFEQILLDPELEDTSVALPLLNVSADPRYGGLASAATAGSHGYTIAARPAPVTLVEPGTAITDRLTGDVLATGLSWSSAHQSAAHGGGTCLVPAWEPAS